MSNSNRRNKKNKASAFLAVLSVLGCGMQGGGNISAMSNGSSYSSGKSSNLSYAMKLFKLDSIGSEKEAAELSKSSIELIEKLNEAFSASEYSAEQLVNESMVKLQEKLSFGQRVYARVDTSTVDKRSESMSQTCKRIYALMEELVKNTNSILELSKDVKSSFNPFVSHKKLTSIQKMTSQINSGSASIKALCLDFKAKMNSASSDTGLSRYDSWVELCEDSLPKIRSYTSDLLTRLKDAESFFSDFSSELKSLPSAYAARKKQLEEEGLSAQEIEEKKKEAKKAEFFENRLKWLANFSNLKKKLSSNFESVYKSADESESDIERLVYKKFKPECDTVIYNIDNEIQSLTDIKEYNDSAVVKTSGIDNKIFEMESQIQKLVESARQHKIELSRKKDELKAKRGRISNKVKALRLKLDGIWNDEISRLDEELAERFKSEAGIAYNEASSIISKLDDAISGADISLESDDPLANLETIDQEVVSRIPKVESCNDELIAKGFELKIFRIKKDISAIISQRDQMWEDYKMLYMPSVLSEKLRLESGDVWENIEGVYSSEKKWEEDISLKDLLKNEGRTKELFENLTSVYHEATSRLLTFKRKIEDSVDTMKKLIEEIRIDEELYAEWSRIFAPEGASDKVREEVGEASKNQTEEDCEKIASVIDRWLPGTKELMLKLADSIRSSEGSRSVYIHGNAGCGKTRCIQYLASAIDAEIIRPDKEMFRKMDGAAYAHLLMDKYKGKKTPLIVLIDEFDSISTNRAKDSDNVISATVNVFLNALEDIGSKKMCNFKLGVYISNIPSSKMDSAHMDRMDLKEVLGDKLDYKRIIETIMSGVKIGASDGSKPEFIKNIVNRCEDLRAAGRTPSPRTIIKVTRACQDDWCKKQNKGLVKGQKGWKEPWHAQLLSSEINAKLNAACDVR